ncbi:radical SAM protein [Elizabethkingia meningoseptica]
MSINSVVIKIASRCNINCSYCYMYNAGDMSYLKQPKFISMEIIKIFVDKIIDYCKKNNLKHFYFSLHGGEPLLMPKKDFVEMVNELLKLTSNNIKVGISIQTNGILLDEEWCEIFKKYNILVGISLDGTKEIHDKYRVDKKGKGTYIKVIKGIEILKKKYDNFSLLSVTNAEIAPRELFNHFVDMGFCTDFLLLESNYDDCNKSKSMGDWLVNMFEFWYNTISTNKIRIRIFETICRNILGDISGTDSLGTSENSILVLETNGGIEAVDVLKICGESFTKNNINIKTHEIDHVFSDLLIDVYYNSGKYLPKKCLACPVQEVCGGGYLPHRYSSKNGFNNPSVYCDDLLKLITHIQNVIIDEMPENLIKETQIEKLTYEDALQIIETTLPTIPEPIYAEKLESFRKFKHENI